MRKMRNSVKAIIIAICTVVVAVSATLGIILLNKNKGKNPAPEYALTQAQKNLVAEINQNALKEQAKNQNNLQVFDSLIFRDENGSAVDTSTVAAFNDESFVVQTGEEVFSAYVYSEVNNVMKTTELISYLKEKDMIDDKYTSIEYDKRYQSQIKDQYYIILKATYTVDETDKFDLIVVDLGDQNDVSILNVLSWNGFSAFNFGFGEHYYIYNYIYRESTGEDILESDVATMYSDITFIDYTSGNSKNVRLYVSENGGLGINSFLNYYSVIPYKTKYTFVAHDKSTNNFNTFDYSVDESFSYEFSGYDAGLLLEKADEYSEDVDYLFVNPYSKKSFELKFDKNYSYSTVYNVSQKYFCVVSMKDENNYKFDYYSNDGTKVISYYSQYEDDYILYGKKNNILTTHAIISTKLSVSANVVSNFGNDEESFVFETEFYPSDYFVVSKEGMNICDVRGELVYDDSFDYIHQYKGIYIASYEEKYYFLDPLNKTKTEIVNFSSISSQNIDDGLNLLKFGLYVVKNNGVFTFLDFEKNLVVFETKFGDRSQFTSLNFVKDEGSGFFFIEATSTNNEIIILTVYDVKDYVFNAPETYSHAVSYVSRTTNAAYRTKYTFSAKHDHWLADDTGSGYVNVTNNSDSAYISYNGVNRVNGIFGTDGGNSCSYSSSYSLSGGNFTVTISSFQVYCYWLDFKWRSIDPSSISNSGSEVKIWTKVNGRKLSGGPYTWKPSSLSYAAGSDQQLYKDGNSTDNTSGSITGATRVGSYFSTSKSSSSLYETNSGTVGINTYLKNGSVFGVHYYRYPAFNENTYTLKFNFTNKYNTSGQPLTVTAALYDGDTKLTSSSSGGSFTVAYTKTLSAAGVTFKSPTLAGYEFKGWYVNGTKISGTSSKLAATGTVTASAYFAPADIDVYFNYVAGDQITSSSNNYNVYIKKRFTPIGDVKNYKYNNSTITTTYLKVGSNYLYNADLFYDSDYYIWGVSSTNYLKKTTMVIDPETSNITGSKSWSGSEYRYFTDDGTYIISTESKAIKGDEGLKATTPSGSIPSSNKWYQSFEVSYEPDKLLTTLFAGSNDNNFTKTCKRDLITVTGQGLQFRSWLVEVNPASGSNYLISLSNGACSGVETSTMNKYIFGGENKNSSGNYPKSVVNGSKEIRVYALYEERDYVVRTDDTNVVYGSSALNTADSGDSPDDKLKDYTTVINNIRTDSKISILKTPINAKFTDTVNVSIYLNGETAAVSDKEAYYVFDKVEIQNYGYRVWVSSNGSTFNYVYGYCTIRFVLSALSPRTWSVEFINQTPSVLTGKTHYYDSSGSMKSFGTTNNDEKFQKLVHKASSLGTNSTYYVRDGHGTQFNTVKISSATATSLVFTVSNCGVTGTYSNSYKDFTLNETSAKSDTGGFKVVAYPKSNYLAKDTISINTANSTGIGSVLGLAIQPLTSVSTTELVFWIDNVKYTTNGVASGFYRLDDKSSGKINKTSTYNFENSAVKSGNTITNYLDVVYVYKNPNSAKASESYVYYPSYLVKSAYPASGTTITSSTVRNWASDIAPGETSASVMKNFNYENMRMFVVKPEQTLITTSLNPKNHPTSTSAYELTSYLSTIVIDSTTSITLKAEKDAISGTVNSNSTYIYDVLRMKSNNKDEEMYPQPSASPAISFDNSGKISYCGTDYVVQSAFKKIINTNSKVTGSSRTVWVYLVKNSVSGEYFYFIYADVDGTKTGSSNAVGFQFTFKQFDKTLSITVDDQSDLYDASNHNSLSYRVVSSANELTLASSGNEYGTKKTYSFGSEYYYKSYGDLTNSTLLKKASYTFNPSSFMILEFVPTSGYLISDFRVRLHNSELGTDLFSLSLKNLEPTINNGNFYYTTTFGSGAEQNFKPAILYNHTGKMFNAYNYNSTYNGIYCTQNYNDNWVQYFTSDPFKMEHIYVVIAGAYDNVSITAKTVSYSELVFEDNDGGNNLAYKADSSTKINSADANYLEGNIYSVASLQNLDILLCDDGTWFKLGSGTKNGSKDAYVVKTGNYYRVILLGKAQYLRSGVKIFASSDNYSYYLTDGRFYNDYNSTDHDSDLDAFNMLRKTGATFTGRTNDAKSLYNSGNSANTSLVNTESAASLNFTQTTLANNAKITYLFINDLLKSHSLNEWKTTSQSGAAASNYTSRILGSYSSEEASKEYEKSNKFVMVFSIRKNEVKFTTNSYLYNNTITQNYGTVSGGLIEDVDNWVSGFEATGTYNSSLVAKLYNDSDNYRLWRYSGGEIAGYQLDYVGKLYDSSGNVIKDASNNDYIYKKESSWFNDTILTNIDYEYYADASTRRNPNWQDVAGNYGKHSNVVSGYNIEYTYYNIPGYYLQFLEIVTVDFGSIYVPVSAITAATQQRIVYSNKSIGITIEVSFDDGVYTILLYDDGTDLTSPINSLGILNNNFTINFYSKSYEYAVYLNANTGESSTSADVLAWNNTGDSNYSFTSKGGYSKVISNYTSVFYDSLNYIGAYLEMPGYTFVGWGSENYNSSTNRYNAATNTWNSSSLWLPIHSYFDADSRSNLTSNFGENSYGYDFYVKASASSAYGRELTTGYFITDTGFSDTENYNFWSVYAESFMATLSSRKPSSTIPILTYLHGIWKANVYTLTFEVNDKNSTVSNGSTIHSLEINSGEYGLNDPKEYFFNDEFIIGNLGFRQETSSTTTYYCYVTFDDNDWFITESAVNASQMTSYDDYYAVENTSSGYGNSYSSQAKFAIAGSSQSNLLNVIIDRYGYSWLGWFTKVKPNANVSSDSNTVTEWMVFNSEYYNANTKGTIRKELPVLGKGKSCTADTFNISAKPDVKSGWLDANASCIDYRWFTNINEPYSDFVYVGEDKLNTSILKTRTAVIDGGNAGSKYLIAFYNYKHERKQFTLAVGSPYGYSSIDFLNDKNGSSKKASKANLAGGSSTVANTYITYFDTSLTYDCYSIANNTSNYATVKVVRDNSVITKLKTIMLYANWETNRYDIVIEWRDNETIKTDYALGSTEAGILQGDGSIHKDTLAPAYFDDDELADRLNKFNPVRVGYDFIGWTYLYDLYEGAVNNPTVLTKDNIETMYYLSNDILTRVKWNNELTRPIFTDAGLVNSLGFAGRQEAFGDIEAMTSHTIYIFAIWKAQTFTINIDLNIQAEQLENLYEKDSNFAVALYNASKPEGTKVVNYNGSTGVRTNYYKFDDNNYSEIVANLNFIVSFDGNFADAYCQIVDGVNTYTYNIEELFAVSTGYYLLGWMLNSTDPNTLFIANGLYSAFGIDGTVVNLDNDGTSNLISGYEVFNYTNYEKLYNSDYKNGLNSKEEGKYGTSKETFNNNNVKSITTLDGAGRSSNFGYVTIGTEKYYITCEDVNDGSLQHYLYFEYEGVKYYVVYYYLSPIDGGNFDSIQLVNDHEFLYYLVDTTKYKIRFDTDGHPYTVTNPNKYSNKIDFYDTIRIAIYRYRTNTLSDNYNCITKHNTPVNHASIGFEFDHDLISATPKKSLYFKVETTRQFTLYAHWKNKNDMYVDIDNMNNYLTNLEDGAPNPNSNPGLAGYYDVWNTYSHAVRDDSMKYDKSFIIENSSATSTSQDEEGIRLTYNYYDDLFINLNPYFNGRYLSEMTFTFYGIEETNYTGVTDKERSTFKLQTYRLVVKFAWDNVNHKIVIAQGGFNLYIGTDAAAKPISTASSVSDGNQLIYNIFANSVPFTKMSLVDKYACETNVNNFFELFKYGSYYDRKDVNQVSFELKNVMTNIEIDCKYSIQTYQIDFYNIKHNAENSLYIKEGTTNEYVTPFTPDDIKPGSALLDENSFKSSTATTHQYLATISTDCAAGSPPGYNVPYGFYIYGVYYNSPYKPYRPIDETGSIGIPTNVVELLRDPMYGFEYIYTHGYYTYGATSKQLKQADASDTYSAQCSGVLGATTVFNDSIGIRLSGLSFYAFGGWYEYYEDDDKIVFVGYNKVAESTYINRNISLYGYYYATNEPTNIQFYTWDKDNLNYVEYTGNTDQYTLNENTEKVNYMQVGGYMTLKEGQTNYVDNEGRVKVISYLQYGVDKTAFGSHNYTNNFIMENSNDENVLSMILDTYWYYEDSYNPLYFLDGGNNRKYIRYDKDTSQFYYLSNENDLNSSKVIVKVQTSDMTNFFLEASGSYNGKRLEFSKTDKLYTSYYGTEYNFSGTNLYAKVNKTGIGDRYYLLYHIDDSYFDGSNPHYKSWMDSKQPKYYLDVEGSRYYMILKNTSGMSKASVFYDANGNEVTASESPVRSAILTTIKNYYVNYQGYLFKINYQQRHDDGGSTYINPFVNPQTNTTTITLLSGEEVECYFNYETRVLYEKLIVKTDSYTYYIKVNKANISDIDKYYKVMPVDPSYYDRFEDDTWAFINKPAYCVDIAGTRYYITSLSTGLGAADIAHDQVIYTAQGDNGGPLTGRTICRLNDYYVEYKGVKYFIEYKVIDGYVNPFENATTNIVKVMIATNTYETCYFDYNTKTLYADVKASFDSKIYCAVNENYKINAVMKTDLWLIDNITIKLLPSPNIGFWYNGEQYGFVGYIEMNKDIFDGLVKKGDAGGGEGTGAGEIYLEFSNLITAVYTKDAFASGRFATTELYESFLNGRSFDEAYDDFVFNLREQVGTRISEYTMDDFLSDLLTAEEYKYVDGNTTAINYIKVNIPITFENLIVDPRTGKQISLSVIAQHEFDIISTNTVVDTKISAIPIYSPFEMEFSESSYVSSGDSKSIQVDTSKMHVWHFEISSNSTYVYKKVNGDYLNFVVLNLEQYAELQANSSNIADYLTHMMNVGKYVAKYSETSGSSLVNIKSDELGDGKFVVLSYYNKTGIIIETNKHVVRVSDNMLYLDIDSGVIDSELVRTNNFQP